MYAKKTNVDLGQQAAHAGVLPNMEAWLQVFQEPASDAHVRAAYDEITDIVLRWQLKPPGQQHLEAIFDRSSNDFWRERWSLWLRVASTTLRERVPSAKADQAALIQRFVEKTLRGAPQARYEASCIVETLGRRVGDAVPTTVDYKAMRILGGFDLNPDYNEVEHMVYRDASWSPALRKTLAEELARQQAWVKSLRETPSFNIPPRIWPSTIEYAAKQARTDLEQGHAADDIDRMRGGINTLIALLEISSAQGKDPGRSMVEVLAAQMDGDAVAAEKLLNQCMQAVSAKLQQPDKQRAAPGRTAERAHCLVL